MKLVCEVNTEIVLYHKMTLKEHVINKRIRQEFDENKKEYRNVCREYENKVGWKREENPDEFDREILKLISQKMGEAEQAFINKVMNTVRECYLAGKSGYIEVMGHIINIQDFSDICVKDYTIKLSKTK